MKDLQTTDAVTHEAVDGDGRKWRLDFNGLEMLPSHVGIAVDIDSVKAVVSSTSRRRCWSNYEPTIVL